MLKKRNGRFYPTNRLLFIQRIDQRMSKNDPHILGKESIGKLLLQYSIPAIIGMTITSIYNIIDSIFIGHGVGQWPLQDWLSVSL
ncbi:hypothetical protein KUBF_22160 [Bacteroides finegoldii]|nr:hypothetical protein KUBF_22160 [Bacteroides finegoldii]